MRSIKLVDVILCLLGLALGPILAVSMARWAEGADSGRCELLAAKQELMASAGLLELHNRIYERVGERAWRERVKPEFMSRIIWETVQESGDLAPGWKDVVGWVRAHPARAREILEAAAR
jgi:hypothetical protein